MGFYTTKLAATALGCSQRTVERWVQRLGIPKLAPPISLLTEEQVEEIRKYVRPGPGRPRKGGAGAGR